MAEPTIEQMTSIASVADWGQTDSSICDLLNAPDRNNPEPPGNVPRRLVKMEVLQSIKAEHRAAVLNYPNLGLVYESFDAQDHESAVNWVYALQMIGAVDQDDAAAAIALITTPVPDPAYQPQISWAQAELGRPVDTADIYTTRRGIHGDTE